MPTANAGKVLVTGANGYIAVWVLRVLLEQGYTVRGTVRSESKGTHLRKLFSSYGDKLELVVIPDITKEGAFDEAVKGVDAIEHTASPFHYKVDEPDEIIVPAVQGTLRVLESALAHGTAVKRIVVTSSLAAIMQLPRAPATFTESDWNDPSVEEIRTKGRNASNFDKYLASKTLAERAAWKFVEDHRDAIKWDLVVLNPPYVFGPAIHEVDSPETLNESLEGLFFSVFKGREGKEYLSSAGASWVDVRDLADAHVLALKTPKAGGERIIINEGPFKYQDFVNAARGFGFQPVVSDDSYDPTKAEHALLADNSKSVRLFGLKYRSIKESTKDMLEDFRSRGWL